jgi:glycosyltransferase involved in cell wall biosynthesis
MMVRSGSIGRTHAPDVNSMASSMRVDVAALVPYWIDTAPSQRFRIEQWAPYLAREGISIRLEPFASRELTLLLRRPGHVLRKAVLVVASTARRLATAARLPRGQMVFLHRAACLAGPPFIERWLGRRGHPILFDFDDAIFLLHSSGANRLLAWLKLPAKTATICRLSRHVVVGNSHLARWARRHNDEVSIIPSSIDTDLYTPRKADRPRSPMVVGWMGSSTSQTYLEAFAPMLSHLVRESRIEIRVVSDRPPELSGVAHSWRPWSAETEVDEVAGFDIGLMPMPDEEWALGKGAFKALQYMAMEVPAVASAVGANREVIQHGVNGLLASTEGEWLECVKSLLRDPDLRTRVGREGRRTVEERFSMRKSAAALAAVVRRLADTTTDR